MANPETKSSSIPAVFAEFELFSYGIRYNKNLEDNTAQIHPYGSNRAGKAMIAERCFRARFYGTAGFLSDPGACGS